MPQNLHATIQITSESFLCFFTAIYASIDFQSRTKLWKELVTYSDSVNGDWLIGGDFNEVLKASETYG